MYGVHLIAQMGGQRVTDCLFAGEIVVHIGDKAINKGNGDGQRQHALVAIAHHLDIFARLRELRFERH